MSSATTPIEIDVSRMYSNPWTDADFPEAFVDEAKDRATFVAQSILELFHAAMEEVGIRKIVVHNVQMHDPYIASLRRFGDIDARYDVVLTFEGDIPAGVDPQQAKVRINNLIMKDLMRYPQFKDGVGVDAGGVENKLFDIIGGGAAPSMPEQKYPLIYLRFGR